MKQNAQFKYITTKPTSKILKKVKSSDNLAKLKPIKSNLSNLKSKSAQNICETNLNDKKTSQDALKVLEFLIQKSKQNNNDSSVKNITFESLFNELNQMNINLKNNNNNNNNLECSLDIKLDQMENEIEVLRMQLKQNQFNKITPKLKTLPQSNINNNNNNKYETIDRLQNELRESNKKCQVLEYLLEQKNKQTEKFNFLYK